MIIELTPELIAITVTFLGVVSASIAIAVRMVKVGRWMERIENRLENLEKGQNQILTALQNHVHSAHGALPLFSVPTQNPNIPPMVLPGDVTAPTGQSEPVA